MSHLADVMQYYVQGQRIPRITAATPPGSRLPCQRSNLVYFVSGFSVTDIVSYRCDGGKESENISWAMAIQIACIVVRLGMGNSRVFQLLLLTTN